EAFIRGYMAYWFRAFLVGLEL
ncbi:uncharacterized protein METZ01_LOCUS418232, partial [marine metagenome]